jgi:ABC-type phosphate transport system permease subunit
MALGVTLFAMTIVVNVFARAAVARAAHQMGGA